MLPHSMYLPWVHTIETTNISRRQWATHLSPLTTAHRSSSEDKGDKVPRPLPLQTVQELQAAEVCQTEDKAAEIEPSR